MGKKWEVLLKCCGNNINPKPVDIDGIVEKAMAEITQDIKESGDDLSDYYIEEEALRQVELSIIDKNNKHGYRSYGWPGLNKVILTNNIENKKQLIEWVQISIVCCNALNNV